MSLGTLRRSGSTQDVGSLSDLGNPAMPFHLQEDKPRHRCRSKTRDLARDLALQHDHEALCRALKRPAASSSRGSTALPPMRPDFSKYQHLRHFVDHSIDSLGETAKDNLCRGLAEIGAGNSPEAELEIKIGTICGGSDLYMSTFKHLAR